MKSIALLLLVPFSVLASAQVVEIDKRNTTDVTIEQQLQAKVQDRNPDQNLSKVPRSWIIFAANPAFTKVGLGPNRHMSYSGHIFVIIATEDLNTESTRIDSYGFYPADGSSIVRAILNEVPGTVKDNLTGAEAGTLTQATRIFSVEVTQTQALDATRAIWAKYPKIPDENRQAVGDFDYQQVIGDSGSADPDKIGRYGPTYTSFSIGGSDCVNLVDTVARAVGLRTPQVSGSNLLPNGYLTSLESMNTSGPPGQSDQQIYTRLNFAYSTTGDPTGWYEGTVDESGKYDGHGIVNAPTGVRYDLNFSHGKLDGPAHLYFPDGGELIGVLDGGNLKGGVYTDAHGGTHAVSLNPDGSLHEDNPATPGGSGSGGGNRGGADHAAGVGRADSSGSGGSPNGDHPLGGDHWGINGNDMGREHMDTMH